MSTRAKDIQKLAKSHGAKNSSTELLDLETMHRKKMCWYSPKIQRAMGVPAKPYNKRCPICGTKQLAFELDHMGPWRTYVAATAGVHLIELPNGQVLVPRDIAKALYNDPENLWWICKTCNGKKSDHASDTATVTPGNLTNGPKGVPIKNVI